MEGVVWFESSQWLASDRLWQEGCTKLTISHHENGQLVGYHHGRWNRGRRGIHRQGRASDWASHCACAKRRELGTPHGVPQNGSLPVIHQSLGFESKKLFASRYSKIFQCVCSDTVIRSCWLTTIPFRLFACSVPYLQASRGDICSVLVLEISNCKCERL